jgi:hypothetical protein
VIPNRLLARAAWEAKLRRWGCKPLEGKGALNTAEWWIGKQGPFTVPIEGDDDRCEFWALKRLCDIHGIHPSELDSDKPH